MNKTVMLCQHCKKQEATVHFAENCTCDPEQSGAKNLDFNIHLCPACARGHEQKAVLGRFKESGETLLREKLKVISVSVKYTRYRLVRTENESVPEDWHLLNSRLPKPLDKEGTELTMIITPFQLEWLKGGSGSAD